MEGNKIIEKFEELGDNDKKENLFFKIIFRSITTILYIVLIVLLTKDIIKYFG